MVNVLIANDNIYFSKQIMDNINSKDVKVSNLAINGEEAFNILNTSDNIDIILLKLKLPRYSGIKVIDMLSDIKKKKYRKSCVVLLDNNELSKKLINNDMIYQIIKNENNITEMVEAINLLIKIKQTENVRAIVFNEIKKLHYNISHIGTNYLIDTILLILKNNNVETFNLKKDVYPKLAQKYNTKITVIKENIYKATDYMDINCDIKTKKEYFNFQEDTKPTVKMVIYSIINHIYRKI